MYTLYYMPGACSRAIHALLIELQADVRLVDMNRTTDFHAINPAGQVPVLVDGDLVLREGVAIILHLLEKHRSAMLPEGRNERARFIQQLAFANATLHPAYGRLFFISQAIDDESARQGAYDKAAAMIASLWQVVEDQLAETPFVTGDQLTIVDIMLAVYANWGGMFPVDIPLGEGVSRLLKVVQQHPSFQQAIAREETHQAA